MTLARCLSSYGELSLLGWRLLLPTGNHVTSWALTSIPSKIQLLQV